jgi:hypothetical protein
LTICSFCCSNLFIEGLITTDGQTGGDKHFNKKTNRRNYRWSQWR